jgi:riboflavin kinase/FMN adenylyltransferase
MKTFRTIDEVMDSQPAGARFGITMGNFDGVHSGHRAFLAEIHDDCRKRGLRSLVITFNPHPHRILVPHESHFLITSYDEKLRLLSELPIDHIVELEFTRDLSLMDSAIFLDKKIFHRDGITRFFVGHDFSFGRGKAADFEFVKSYCAGKGVSADIHDQFRLGGESVCSTRIRQLVRAGEIEKASLFLGRPFMIAGLVKKGVGRGRQMGFPTANLDFPEDRLVPAQGVYFSRTKQKDVIYPSITNVGINPTFGDTNTVNVETHILDFDRLIYGETIEVEFLSKLRDEIKFDSRADLISKITDDVARAQRFFKQ